MIKLLYHPSVQIRFLAYHTLPEIIHPGTGAERPVQAAGRRDAGKGRDTTSGV